MNKNILWLLAFYAYCALALLWSPDQRYGALVLRDMAVVFVFAAVFATIKREILIKTVGAFSCGLMLVATTLSFIDPKVFGGFGNENFVAEFLAILTPFTFMAGRYCIPVLIFALAYLIGFNNSNILYAALAGYLFIGLVWLAWKKQYWLAFMGALVPLNVALYSGWATGPGMVGSLKGRLEIFTNTVFMWLDAPLFGHGTGSFNYVYPLFREKHIEVFPWLDTLLHPLTIYVGAAHNEILQILAEWGLVGLLIAGVCLWKILRLKVRDKLTVCAVLSLYVCFVLSMIEFPLHNPATAIPAAMALGIAANDGNRLGVRFARWPIRIAVMLFVFVLGFTGYKSYAADLRFSVTKTYLREYPLEGLKANLDAYKIFPWDRHIRHQLALSIGRVLIADPENVRLEPVAADTAHRIAETASPSEPALLVARAQYLLNSGRWKTEEKEFADLLSQLQTVAKLQGATWLLTGFYGLANNDPQTVIRALIESKKIRLNDFEKAQFRRIETSLVRIEQ